MPWQWAYFPPYRLSKPDLQRYLVKEFGNYNFYLDVRAISELYQQKGLTGSVAAS